MPSARPNRLVACVRCVCLLLLLCCARGATAQSNAPVEYRLSFDDAVHHAMQVEVTFRDVPPGPLQVRMSRSSPGRYAAHDFAKNVFEETITDGKGKPLTATRPNPHEWDIAGHDGTVHITYKLYGNRVDGTYLAVDSTHAHMNMPATVMWARGFDDRPARLTFVRPGPAAGGVGANWKIATQLYPTNDPLTFTAPNLQYLMDSPTEFSNYALRTFTVPPVSPRTDNAGASTSTGANTKPQTFRVTMHHLGTDAELDAYTADVEKIVREEQAIFGEFPDYEPGNYTFLADYLPWDDGDGMEHRNSTVMSGRASLASNRTGLLGTVAHEFFHNWNVERIRPATLEPFNFEDANISDGLWLAEGFTNYYGKLAMLRAGISDRVDGVRTWSYTIAGALSSPGTKFRSAVDMSRLAPFVDAATSIDPTYWPNTFYSYYPFGEVVALGLDLTLRVRTDSQVTLDDFMRAMWRTHGKPGGPAPGLVGKPYAIADAKARLAEVTKDQAFADDFFRRYIEGTERIDYAALLQHAGFLLRKRNPGAASLGQLRLDKKGDTMVLVGPTIIGSPAYAAGLDQDDELLSIAGTPITSQEDVTKVLSAHKPGDEVDLAFKRRDQEVRAKTKLAEDERIDLVPIEQSGPTTNGAGTLTDAQKRFRDAWLGSKAAKQP
jgi:predicted metalloprotease with PDZ domain